MRIFEVVYRLEKLAKAKGHLYSDGWRKAGAARFGCWGRSATGRGVHSDSVLGGRRPKHESIQPASPYAAGRAWGQVPTKIAHPPADGTGIDSLAASADSSGIVASFLQADRQCCHLLDVIAANSTPAEAWSHTALALSANGNDGIRIWRIGWSGIRRRAHLISSYFY